MRRKDGHLPYISIPNDLNDNQMSTWLRVEHWSNVVLFNDELVDIGDWSVGISWDRCHKLHCLMCLNFTSVHHCFFVPTLQVWEDQTAKEFVYFLLPLTVGFFEIRLYWGTMMVKNPLWRACFLGGIGGVGCWIHVNMLATWKQNPHQRQVMMSWVNNSQRALFLMLLTNVIGVLPKFRSAKWCCFVFFW